MELHGRGARWLVLRVRARDIFRVRAHRLVLRAMRPEGCTARPVTSERCPASVLRQSQLGAAHTVIVPSALQEHQVLGPGSRTGFTQLGLSPGLRPSDAGVQDLHKLYIYSRPACCDHPTNPIDHLCEGARAFAWGHPWMRHSPAVEEVRRAGGGSRREELQRRHRAVAGVHEEAHVPPTLHSSLNHMRHRWVFTGHRAGLPQGHCCAAYRVPCAAPFSCSA